MADIAQQLTRGSYSATKRDMWSTEIVQTDGGQEFRNQRWTAPLAEWDVTIPFCKRNSTQYLAATALLAAAKGSWNTFTFHDTVDCVDVQVRLVDDSMAFTPNGNLVQIDFTVKEVRLNGNSP